MNMQGDPRSTVINFEIDPFVRTNIIRTNKVKGTFASVRGIGMYTTGKMSWYGPLFSR